MNTLLKTQIRLTQERLTELRKRSKIEINSSVSTTSTYGTILSQRIKGMSFIEIGKLIGMSAVAASKRLDRLIEHYGSRKKQVDVYRLRGDSWEASSDSRRSEIWGSLPKNPFTLQSRIPYRFRAWL